MALKNAGFNHRETIKLLQSKINEMEPQAFERANSVKEDISEKIHRIQFGVVDVSKNSRINKLILKKSNKKNPKVLIYVSSLHLISVVNNLSWLKRRFGRHHRRLDFWRVRRLHTASRSDPQRERVQRFDGQRKPGFLPCGLERFVALSTLEGLHFWNCGSWCGQDV